MTQSHKKDLMITTRKIKINNIYESGKKKLKKKKHEYFKTI